MAPLGGSRALGMTTKVPGEPFPALLVAYRDDLSRPPFDERDCTVGELLYPVFRGAVAVDLRLRELRVSLEAVLDRLPDALAVVGKDGGLAHVNVACARLLAGDPERARLESALRAMARALNRSPRHRAALHAPERVRTLRGQYRLDPVPLKPGDPGDPLVAIRVVPLFEVRLPEKELRQRFALTPRQVHVAYLLAQGASNPDAARTLGISVHTVKRHVESVLRKLGVRSRAQVRSRITMG
ncbi:MAG: LuxR C-terminal-related transcriptional regulator [Gemmatimonadota bacterium]